MMGVDRTRIKFVLPASFQPPDCLPRRLWTYGDDTRDD